MADVLPPDPNDDRRPEQHAETLQEAANILRARLPVNAAAATQGPLPMDFLLMSVARVLEESARSMPASYVPDHLLGACLDIAHHVLNRFDGPDDHGG